MTKRWKVCEECGRTFDANPKLSATQWAATTTCSRACRDRRCKKLRCEARPPISQVLAERHTVDPATGCWMWTGTLNSYGYGVFRWRGRTYGAHVASLNESGRAVPKGMIACHHCDTPACINPDHLYVGTPADNARDASERKRLRAGASHPQSKLNELSVLLIRSSGWSNARLARWLGVSRVTVSRAREGRTWTHVA